MTKTRYATVPVRVYDSSFGGYKTVGETKVVIHQFLSGVTAENPAIAVIEYPGGKLEWMPVEQLTLTVPNPNLLESDAHLAVKLSPGVALAQ